ncbi:MAG TPA: MmcQ/YjbR family DNA-binding protein [Gammaproteobacteria bacterium]|nr:MmcQ/YjbR family DNA-binding protein [Gammaproteobacteria bacterium]
MPQQKKIGFDDVREIALAMPGVAASTSWRAPSFKVGGRLFACQAIHRSAEPGSLMVRVERSLRDELLATEPDVYYVTPHYESYPCLLVRLERIGREALERLLGISCFFVSSTSSPSTSKKRARTKRGASPGGKRPGRRRSAKSE